MESSKKITTVDTPFGPIEMDGELPTRDCVTKLFDQLDFQQAAQTYLWALPLVTAAQWQHVHNNVFETKNGDIVYYGSYEDKIGILLANATTPYIISFLDLSLSGPMVIEIPQKEITGILSDFWQRVIALIGLVNPDQVTGGKYIVLPPGTKTPEDSKEFEPVLSSTMNVLIAMRSFETNQEKGMEQVKKVKIYPYSQRSSPPTTQVVTPNGRKYYMGQPRGLDYWQLLHAIIQHEVVADRDRFFMAVLHNLGIDKGAPFDPTERQRQILIQGAEAGELFAKVNTFSKRFPGVKYWPDRQWTNLAVMENVIQAVENYDLLNERSCYHYETVVYSKSFLLKAPGMGQLFFGTATDSRGAWLDGAKAYTLYLAPNPPAKIYWSFSIYDVDTRKLVENERSKSDIYSKRDEVLLNRDDSISLYFGPAPPQGKEQNWLQTIPGKHWFGYFRLYYPLEPIFNKTWKMGDIEELKSF